MPWHLSYLYATPHHHSEGSSIPPHYIHLFLWMIYKSYQIRLHKNRLSNIFQIKLMVKLPSPYEGEFGELIVFILLQLPHWWLYYHFVFALSYSYIQPLVYFKKLFIATICTYKRMKQIKLDKFHDSSSKNILFTLDIIIINILHWDLNLMSYLNKGVLGTIQRDLNQYIVH